MDELIKTIILNAPNFIGFLAAVIILYRQNAQLLNLVEKLSLECQETRPAIQQEETD